MCSSLLLASNSPRRRELLAEAGFDFAVASPRVTEKLDIGLTLRELTAFNAFRKGMSIARVHPKQIVLAADTMVGVGNRIIGKPKDLGEAVTILRLLSGRDHEVCSSVFICQMERTRSTSFQEISRVHFRELSDLVIHAYVERVNPLDKAGAYAAQGGGNSVIAKIEGSYTNVVGLPMEKTIAALAKFGVRPSSA